MNADFCVYLFVDKTIYKQNKMWSVQFFSVFKEKSVKDYWEKMLSDSYCSAKELHRETIAKIALLYQNSSI